MDVLRGFSLARWKPRIVILEDNDFGASDAVTDYMEAKGYRRFRNTVCNDWYGRKDDRALFGTRQVVFTEIRKTFTDCKRVVGRHARRIVRLMKEG